MWNKWKILIKNLLRKVKMWLKKRKLCIFKGRLVVVGCMCAPTNIYVHPQISAIWKNDHLKLRSLDKKCIGTPSRGPKHLDTKIFGPQVRGPKHLDNKFSGPLLGVPNICKTKYRGTLEWSKISRSQNCGTPSRGLKHLDSKCMGPLVGVPNIWMTNFGSSIRTSKHLSSSCLGHL